MKTLYLCGAGNSEGVRLALRINREQSRWERILLLDDDPAKHGGAVLGIDIVGPFSMLADADPGSAEISNLVARTASRRYKAREKLERYGVPFATLVDPGVDLLGTRLGTDIIVYHHATVGANSSIDESSVVLMGATVGHECRVGHGCIVAPHALLNARVEIGDGAYIGSNATVLPEVMVGSWATIAAGSVAMEDVPSGATVMGIPAKVVMPLAAKLRMPGADPLPEAVRRQLERQNGTTRAGHAGDPGRDQ